VCSPEARADAESLQHAFDRHPSIYMNIGPALSTTTDRTGKKAIPDRALLKKLGLLGGCMRIYVSVHGQPSHAAQQGNDADRPPLTGAHRAGPSACRSGVAARPASGARVVGSRAAGSLLPIR